MKKFYSLVLMAAALLIGTNAWAVTRQAANDAQLQAAWAAAQNGDVIQLTNDITLTKPLWLGTVAMNDAAKSITLNLGGKTLTADKGTVPFMFIITHGELNVENGNIIHSGTGKISSDFVMFHVCGSTYKNVDPKTATSGYFTHLNIASDVKLTAHSNAIAIDRMASWKKGAIATYGVTTPTSLPYNTNVYNDSYGVANGVRVDVYGTVHANKYGIKANGNMGSPATAATAGKAANYWADPEQTIQYVIAESDVNYAPFIHVHSSAEIKTLNPSSSAAIATYSGGYSRWLIEGYCEGSTGVYVKSGEVTLDDAIVKSNYEGTYVPAGREGIDRKSGVDAGGSGVVVESATAYAGNIDVNVQGDTKVTGTTGYAIDEAVTAVAGVTKVDGITITGGTFETGATGQGAIKISEPTADANAEAGSTTEIIIAGGQADGSITLGDPENPHALDEVVKPVGGESNVHVTYVDNGNGGTTMVISQGEAPTGDPNVAEGHNAESKVSWEGASETLVESLTLAELEMNWKDGEGISKDQVLYVGDDDHNVTLKVGRIIMGAKAQIVVHTGSKLIVTGEQGIVAPVASNIVLRTSEAAQAMFLFSPEVSSNRNPNATVELISKAYRKANGQYVFQRFGVPSSSKDITRADMIYTVPTALYAFSYEENDWKSMANTDKFVPFQCYTMTTQQTEGGALYKFQCPLVGNNDAELKLQDKWNYFANSYAAPIDLKQIVNRFKESNADAVDATIYLFDEESNWWEPRNNASLLIPTNPKQIVPMQPFIIKRVGNGEDPKVKYAEHIWTPIMDPSHNAFKAPARSRQNVATVVVEIADANGLKDKVTLIEGEQFSADYDLTYDAEKYINENSFNIFANSNEAQMGIVATDNLEGMELGLNTKAQTSFTMTFSGVSNMNYAVRDMLTGTEIEIVEGATYMFSVPENTTVEGRFEIVPVAKMPTAIDNIAETAAIKGIYTVAGQFVGYNYHNLPNGIYVVDGKKIVK